MLKLVIFDLDGVLVDACEWHRVALNEALVECCDYSISMEDHNSVFNGIPTKVKLKKLVEMGAIPQEKCEQVYASKQQKTIDTIIKCAIQREEKIELINWLKQKNINIACFTNSIRETAILMLEKTGIHDLFEIIVTNEDVDKPKPDPEGYEKVLKHFNYYPKDAIIVEDSLKGITAALAAKCKVLQVKNADEVNIKNMERFINENFDTNGGRR